MAFFIAVRQEGNAVRALGAHRELVRLAHALTNAFLWIFIFQWYASYSGNVGDALRQMLLLYALVETITLLCTPLASRLIRAGMLRGMVWGTLTLCSAYIYTGMLLTGEFAHGAVVIATLFGVHRAFYRVPYTVERANIGAQTPSFTSELVLALMPLAAGLFLITTIFDPLSRALVLLCIAALLAFAALIPLFQVPQVYERFSWGYRESFGRLFAPENHRLLIVSVRQGILGALFFLVWPLSLFLVSGSYKLIGAMFSATLLIILLFRASNRRVWVEDRADASSYLDEYTTLKEMGMAAGRLAFALAGVIALGFWGF